MTTKEEEVLRLAEEAGFVLVDYSICLHVNGVGNVGVTGKITKLIELAKAQGAAEERNKYNNFIERLRQIPMVEPASADTELNELVELFDAIRNRERKE